MGKAYWLRKIGFVRGFAALGLDGAHDSTR